MRLIVHSDYEAANAAAGLIAVALAWLGFLGLRCLGRQHLARPNLGEQIRREAEESPQAQGNDYYI